MKSAPTRGKRPAIQSFEVKLATAFRRAMALSLGIPAALQGCGGDDASSGADAGKEDATVQLEGGNPDATADTSDTGMPQPDVAVDTGPGMDAAQDAGADASLDAITDAASDGGFVQCDEASVGAPYFTTDAAKPCYYYVDLSCPLYSRRGPNSCYLNTPDCLSLCSLDAGIYGCAYTYTSCTLAGVWIAEAGQPVTVGCELCFNAGRRPMGLRRAASRGATPLGCYLARTSHLEAASVLAFERLRAELLTHGAPPELVVATERAAKDEVRHARLTAALARRHGAQPARVRVRGQRARGLEQVARENAVEGCVRETFGALLAAWQAAHASDPDVGRLMTRIAVDERRHAALGWAVAAWARTKLDRSARRRIARAQRAAASDLARELSVDLSSSLAREAGLPSTRQARSLVTALSEMWNATE